MKQKLFTVPINKTKSITFSLHKDLKVHKPNKNYFSLLGFEKVKGIRIDAMTRIDTFTITFCFISILYSNAYLRKEE